MVTGEKQLLQMGADKARCEVGSARPLPPLPPLHQGGVVLHLRPLRLLWCFSAESAAEPWKTLQLMKAPVGGRWASTAVHVEARARGGATCGQTRDGGDV